MRMNDVEDTMAMSGLPSTLFELAALPNSKTRNNALLAVNRGVKEKS
jgi:hypothetical protein